jgi:hypothetical protein
MVALIFEITAVCIISSVTVLCAARTKANIPKDSNHHIFHKNPARMMAALRIMMRERKVFFAQSRESYL